MYTLSVSRSPVSTAVKAMLCASLYRCSHSASAKQRLRASSVGAPSMKWYDTKAAVEAAVGPQHLLYQLLREDGIVGGGGRGRGGRDSGAAGAVRRGAIFSEGGWVAAGPDAPRQPHERAAAASCCRRSPCHCLIAHLPHPASLRAPPMPLPSAAPSVPLPLSSPPPSPPPCQPYPPPTSSATLSAAFLSAAATS